MSILQDFFDQNKQLPKELLRNKKSLKELQENLQSIRNLNI